MTYVATPSLSHPPAPCPPRPPGPEDEDHFGLGDTTSTKSGPVVMRPPFTRSRPFRRRFARTGALRAKSGPRLSGAVANGPEDEDASGLAIPRPSGPNPVANIAPARICGASPTHVTYENDGTYAVFGGGWGVSALPPPDRKPPAAVLITRSRAPRRAQMCPATEGTAPHAAPPPRELMNEAVTP